jgi:hypothetical protein
MWHRLDRILGGRREACKPPRCEACGEPLGPDPAIVFQSAGGRGCRQLCSPECLPSVWKKVEIGRQKVSDGLGRDRLDLGDKFL